MNNTLQNIDRYISFTPDNEIRCSCPQGDKGITAITLKKNLTEEEMRVFSSDIKKLVVKRVISPAFSQIIFGAINMIKNRHGH